jgi:hypothetical protein
MDEMTIVGKDGVAKFKVAGDRVTAILRYCNHEIDAARQQCVICLMTKKEIEEKVN